MAINYHSNTASIRDDYRTPSDRIWGDVIKHERVLELMWKKTWENTIVPKECRPKNYLKPIIKKDIGAFHCFKPSPPVPLKASAVVGWRSSDPKKSLDYFNVKYISNKKRFTKEQYGNYRALKYIEKAENEDKCEEVPTRNEKYIKHTIKRLVC